MFPATFGCDVPQEHATKDALKIVRELRFLAYGSYTVLNGAKVRVVLHLEDLMSSQ
jgi:hypothetical protein